MHKKRLLIISILVMPGVIRPDLYDSIPEGPNDLHWIRRRLAQNNLEDKFELHHIDICVGDVLPDMSTFDAVVVGGSYHNANEGHPWQLALFEWLARWRDTERPLLGLCGGHQHAAIALGGKVGVMSTGVKAATTSIELTSDGREHYLFKDCGNNPDVHLAHYDHVERAPAGAKVLATHEGIIQALDMGGEGYVVTFGRARRGRGAIAGP